MKDIFGTALLDYQNGNYTEDIITSTSISDEDILPLDYLFRAYSEMPKLEQRALKLVKGSILDVGAGAGSHSLYLQNNGFSVKAIDSSKGAIEVCKLRGVQQAELRPLLEETSTFDTILLLMNGTGIFQSLLELPNYLMHLKSLLNSNGQILIDSSDIKYMYLDDDGGYWHDANANYYGELDYFLSYKQEKEIPLKWLYLDFNTLAIACASVGLNCEKVLDGEHYDYLAKLSL
ncbi:class I SAM-dependent methyltransferase [Pontimicrobium sp. MEBiC01747]